MLARDRVGKKPLYYAERGGALAFASELAALLEDAEIPRDVDHHALDAFLAYRWVPAPHDRVPRGAQAAAGRAPWSSRTDARRSRATGGSTSRASAGRRSREVHEELREQHPRRHRADG